MNFNNPKESYSSSTKPNSYSTERHPVYPYQWDREDVGLTPTYEDYAEFFSDLEDYSDSDEDDQINYGLPIEPDSLDNDLPLSANDFLPANEPHTETPATPDVETKSKLVWNEGNEWVLKREYFSFNQPTSERYKDGTVTLTFSQKEWDRLISISEKFGMPVEDYLECCALKIQPIPFGMSNNHELWKRLLSFQDKMEQFENLLQFCSDDLINNVFGSENILNYWLERFEDAHEQIDMFFNLMYMFGRNKTFGAL